MAALVARVPSNRRRALLLVSVIMWQQGCALSVARVAGMRLALGPRLAPRRPRALARALDADGASNGVPGDVDGELADETDEDGSGVAVIEDPRVGFETIDVCDEMQTSYLSYAMSVILSRALPDVRDGLKPVQRRILFAMDQLSITPSGRYRKCARVVGEVLGKYHPHGDTSVYDALVRMAQPFNFRSTLVDGHGNFGSADPDPPAAMRYTECKLSALAHEALLAETSEATVPYADNFDSSEREPTVLPAKMPMLLLNGAVGIAVGMATSIPPHNPTELCDAVIALLTTPDLSDDALFNLVRAPDFPTGGEILGLDGVRSLYTTGQGVVRLRGKISTESTTGVGSKAARHSLVVHELPYAVTKSAFILKVAELVQAAKLAGISEVRDESDRDGMRIVLELKRDANPALVTNHILKATPLQSSFAGNLLALTQEGRQPTRVSLREALTAFIAFRKQTTRARAQAARERAAARLHIAQGLGAALSAIDAVVVALRAAASTDEARAALCAGGPDAAAGSAAPIVPGGLSAEQADAILAMPLRRLTQLESGKLEAEAAELRAEIGRLSSLLADESVLTETLVAEQRDMRARFGSERRTRISSEARELSDSDLIQNERCVVLMTARGYLKRMPLDEFAAQGRGTRGKAAVSAPRGANDAEADAVVAFFGCNQHDVVLSITERGIVHSRRAYEIPASSRTALGTPVHQLLPIAPDEKVQGFLAVPSGDLSALKRSDDAADAEDDTRRALAAEAADGEAEVDGGDGPCLLLITRHGFIKKTPLAAFASIQARGLVAISLGDGDELLRAMYCPARATGVAPSSVIVASADGNAMRFSLEDDSLRPTGRASRGVRAMRLRDGDEVVDADILHAAEGAAEGDDESAEPFLLAVTANGYGKRVPANAFRVQGRGGGGKIAIKFKQNLADKPDKLVALRGCRVTDEVLLSTAKGTALRQAVREISEQSRTATGVLMQRLDPGDEVGSAAVLPQGAEAEPTDGDDDE